MNFWTFWTIYLILRSKVGLAHNFSNIASELPYDLEKELSLQSAYTLLSLNSSEANPKPLGIQDIMFNVSEEIRKGVLAPIQQDTRRHAGSYYDYTALCYAITTTYKTATRDLWVYYHKRVLFQNNLEYEVGYLTFSIIYKYTSLLEIYQMVHGRYYLTPHKNYAPPTYMLFIYTNMLQLSHQIIHFCNMLHELPEKYKPKGTSAFDDYPFSGGASNISELSPEQLDNMFRKIEERREREKLRAVRLVKKKVQNDMKMGVWVTPTYPRKQKKRWPNFQYGWSVEDLPLNKDFKKFDKKTWKTLEV